MTVVDDVVAGRPLDDLRLSARAYGCLRRAGLVTVGDLVAVLPQRWVALRGAGPKTWGEIEEALSNYLEADDPPPASLANPLQAAGSAEPETQRVCAAPGEGDQAECLPDSWNLLQAVQEGHVHDLRTLLSLPLSYVVRFEGVESLRRDGWSRLVQMAKSLGPSIVLREHSDKEGISAPLDDLGLSRRSFNCLRRRGVTEVQELLRCSMADVAAFRGVGVKSIAEIASKLRAYLSSYKPEVPQEPPPAPQTQKQEEGGPAAHILPAATPEQGAVPEQQDEIRWQSLAEWIGAWLARLRARQQEVMRWRYGLIDGERQTLEEIGNRLGVSRERVRQIEAKAIKRLRHRVGRRAVAPLLEHLQASLGEHGGLATEAELGEALAEYISMGSVKPDGAARLLMSVDARFSQVGRTEVWGLSQLRLAFIREVERHAARILAREWAPLPEQDLLQRLKASKWYLENAGQVPDAFALACFRVSVHIMRSEDGSCALERWERSYKDEIIVALRQLGRPAHYREITQVINATHRSDQPLTPRMVHIRLTQDRDRFVWVGQRGTYGLKEWGLERPPTYEVALVQILERAGHPLTFQEVLARLHEVRPYYEESSVVLTLGTNSRFRAFSADTYGLAEWKEEDFSHTYRLQRLFENGGRVTGKGPKREVLDAINTVDDFIAQAREKGSDGQ